MKRFLLPLICTSLLGATVVITAPLYAQGPGVGTPAPLPAGVTETPKADGGTATTRVKTVMQPNLFAAPLATRPIKVAVYFGDGTPTSNSEMLVTAAKRIKDAEVTNLSAEDFGVKDLSGYDVVVFPGGSGSGQAKALGDAGRDNIRKFVKNGGGYLGICAGAYLATSGYSWGLGLYNAKTLQPWLRGGGAVGLQLTDEGKGVLGNVSDPFPVRYNNGPVIVPDDKADLPAYHVVAYFRNELTKKPEQVGQMTDTPAIVTANFGTGRVMSISPHFEGTKNAENVLPRVIAWLAEKGPVAPTP